MAKLEGIKKISQFLKKGERGQSKQENEPGQFRAENFKKWGIKQCQKLQQHEGQ